MFVQRQRLILFRLFFVTVALLLPMFVNAQVDLPSGRAQIALPLFNFDDNDRLATSVQLLYTDGAGIKVNRLASDVGLGWELQAGGAISRITRGEPDDQMGGELGGELYATGILYTPYGGRTVPYGMGWVPLNRYSQSYFKYSAEVIADRQQDEFAFNFGGRTGRFVIARNGSIHPLDDSKLRIEKTEEDLTASGIITRISKFIIIDEAGTRYTFSEKVTGKIISYQNQFRRRFFLSNPAANLGTFLADQEMKVSPYSAVNGWYLTEISDPATGKKISFTYEGYTVDYISDLDAVETITPADNGNDVVRMKSQTRVLGTLKRIKQIELPDESKLKFVYSTAPRVDLPGANALIKINIERDGVNALSYNLDYQYFSRTNLRDFTYTFPASEISNARLALKSITKIGNDNVADKPFIFSYINDLPGVPGRLGASTDHWGYYNVDFAPWDTDENTFNNLRMIARTDGRRIFNLSSIQQGLLKSVQYPNGGSINYEYEQNTALSGTSNILTGGVRVKKTIYKDGVNASPDIVREYAYVTEEGKSSGWGYEEPQYAYTSKAKYIVPTSGTYNAARLSHDLAMPLVQTGFSNYSHFDNPQYSVGNAMVSRLVSTLISSAIFYAIADLFFPDQREMEVVSNCTSSLYAKQIRPLPGTYSRVVVYNGDAAINRGKTVYEFTTDRDFAIPFLEQTQGGIPRYIASFYGLMKRKRAYNSNNEIISEEYNKYDAITSNLDRNFNYSVDIDIKRTVICPAAQMASYYRDVSSSVVEFYPLVGFPQLKMNISRIYTDNSNYSETRSEYSYDTNHNLKKLITSNSLNEKIEKRIFYPYDYNISGVLTQLKNDRILSVPVATETWLIAEGKEDRIIGAEIAGLAVLPNGAIKPEKIYRLLSKGAVAKSVIGDFNPTSLIRNTNLFKQQEQFVYDNAGNIIETVLNGRMETNIYDDRNDLVIAKIANAAPLDVAFSSFENRAKGNWSIVPAGSGDYIVTNTAIAGSNSLNLSAVTKVEKSGLNTNTRYQLSYWSQGGNVAISGGTVKTREIAAVRNGWTLTSVIITGASTVSITGSGYIDELRLLPEDASMATQTYDAFRNISSATDAYNFISYFEYDGLGRAKVTRDADKNIIQANEYQYK